MSHGTLNSSPTCYTGSHTGLFALPTPSRCYHDPDSAPARICLPTSSPRNFRIFLQLARSCVSLSSSGPRRSHDSFLGSQHNALGIHPCAGAIAPDSPSGFALCSHPTVAHVGWHGKCVMAVVGEKGSRDDVMREDQEQPTEAGTVPTCVSAPLS